MKKKTIILILLILVSCLTRDRGLREIPTNQEHVIRLMRIIDPRLPSLSETDFLRMVKTLKGYIHEYLGYRVTFFVKADRDLLAFQKDTRYLKDTEKMQKLQQSLLNPSIEKDRLRLKKYISALIRKTDPGTLKAYVPEYEKHKQRMADHLFQEYTNKLEHILNIKTSNGTVLNHPAFRDMLTYPFWEIALQHLTEADFIFTNTIMADMEVDIPIYVILRYGITTGMVTENHFNSYQAAGVIFTMPFLSKDIFFQRERIEEIPESLLPDVIALYATHEFGHFLNRFRDYYNHKNCIMVPANDLNYQRWYRERKAAKCPLKHEKLKQF